MSYVIQNFFNFNKKITLMPRFKFFFMLCNLNKLFFLFKINTFLNLTNKILIIDLNFHYIFLKYFFSKYFIKLFINLNFNLIGDYTNNLFKSYIYNIFFHMLQFLKFNSINIIKYNSSQIYLFSIKISNFKINSVFYKNIFFFFLFLNCHIWNQYNSNFKFYLNFILINQYTQIYYFYNGYFLNIYNY